MGWGKSDLGFGDERMDGGCLVYATEYVCRFDTTFEQLGFILIFFLLLSLFYLFPLS